jgi:DDE superfamily endonuclease
MIGNRLFEAMSAWWRGLKILKSCGYFGQPHEKWIKDCIQPVRTRRVKIMAWGCFYGSTCGTFSPIIMKSFNARLYVKLLEYLLVPVIDRISRTLGIPHFMHDNSKVHEAQLAKDWLENSGYRLDKHPHYSPDLNPIEHVWGC